jgi:hypothetical protein
MSTRRAEFRRLAVVFALVTILFLCLTVYWYFIWPTTLPTALSLGFNLYGDMSLGISAASLVVTMIFGIGSLPAWTRSLLMMLGSALMLIAGAAFPCIRVMEQHPELTPSQQINYSLLQLALLNGPLSSFAILLETATALLLIGIWTYSRRLRALTGSVGFLGRAVNLVTIASFVCATITIVNPYEMTCSIIICAPCITTFGCESGASIMWLAPSPLGFVLVAVGVLVATIGSWVLNRPEDDSAGVSAGSPATVTTPSAKPQ